MDLPLQTTGDGGDGTAPFHAARTPYDVLGGAERVRALVDTFYDTMDASSRYADIRSLHPEDLAGSRDKLLAFLTGWLGGPPLYVQRFGHPRLRARHLPFAIGESERDQWLACMGEAMDACGIGGEVRTFLEGRFAHVADFMRNT